MSAAVAGVLLAGGLSRRMGGGDKCLRELSGKPILAHVIERVAPQVQALVLNANGDPSRFRAFGLPVVADTIEGFAGPLAGVLAGMDWVAAMRPDVAWLASIPTDAPFLPRDLVGCLRDAVDREGADMACARSGGRTHPVAGLWPVRLAGDLRAAMTNEGVRKVDAWTARFRMAEVEFATDRVDPFFNANRPGDLEKAERIAAELNEPLRS